MLSGNRYCHFSLALGESRCVWRICNEQVSCCCLLQILNRDPKHFVWLPFLNKAQASPENTPSPGKNAASVCFINPHLGLELCSLLEAKDSATHLGNRWAKLYFEGISLGVNLLFQSVQTGVIVQIPLNS